MNLQSYNVTGMSCAACVSHVENAVKKVSGVKEVSVNLLRGTMMIEGNPKTEQIINAVEKAGYGASVQSPDSENTIIKTGDGNADERKAGAVRALRRLIVSAVLSAALMYLAMGHMLNLPLPAIFIERPDVMALTQFLLTVPVIILNYEYFTNGFGQLARFTPNMNSLIAVGSGSAFIWGIYALYASMFGKDVSLYFDSAAMILTLIDVGKYLEAKAKGKTGDAIEKLMKLTPDTASVRRNGEEIVVPTSQLRTGDIVLVRGGSSIPADGTVILGSASVDESSITGESLPADKDIGDAVIGGTVSVGGYFEMKVTGTGKDTALAKIIQAVDEAMSSKAPIQKMADKVSGVFVPVVIGIAVLTFIIWIFVSKDIEKAFTASVSVLVISCPCALGLATPTAVTVGVGRGAQGGILIKSGEALETLNSVKTVALDKTGTVTEGRMSVTDIVPDGIDGTELLKTAASAEAKSEHPIARAITDEAIKRGIVLSDTDSFKSVTGRGIAAEFEGKTVNAGNLEYMRECGISISDEYTKLAASFAEEGKTALYAAKDGIFAGISAVSDTIKPDSRQAVEDLNALGLDVVMITGDNEKTARAVAEKAGIKKVISGVKPTEKSEAVYGIKTGGGAAMVGDGVNDAPSLAAADVGIAIGAGTDIAVSSADIVLMRNSIADVVNAVRLSRATMRIITQNLFWALIYNTICIPLAAGILYPAFGVMLSPMIGSAAMSVSSVTVVSNALRLKKFRFYEKIRQKKYHTSETQKGETEMFGKTETVRLGIKGMMCEHCVAHVKQALSNVKGVESAEVSLEDACAVVKVKGFREDDIKKAVKAAGYEVVSAEKTGE